MLKKNTNRHSWFLLIRAVLDHFGPILLCLREFIKKTAYDMYKLFSTYFFKIINENRL